MKQRVLFAWELGANLGHLGPIAPLASELVTQGIEPWFCVRDLGSSALVLANARSSGVKVLQAPQWPRHRHWGHSGKLADISDIFVLAGVADTGKLTAMMGAWSDLLALVRPNVVVADHAPALLALLYGGDTPVISIGSPYLMPPIQGDRFAAYHAGSAPLIPPDAFARAIRLAREGLGLAGPTLSTDIFRTANQMAFGLAEFDPFAAARRDVLYDPADGLPAWTEPPDKPRLFVYLGPETPHFEVIVQALVGLNVPIEAHFRGEGGPVAHLLKLRGHVVHDAPPSLTDVLQRVSHVVTMGGLGVSQAALAAGRPQLVMPLHDETQHNYRVLNERGVVQRLWPEQDEHNLRKQIFAFLSSGHRMAAAKEASLQIGRRARNCGRVALMGAIRKHLA